MSHHFHIKAVVPLSPVLCLWRFFIMKESGLLTLCAALMILAAQPCRSETGLEGRKQVILTGNIASIGVDIAGGSIVDFHLVKRRLNPFSWNYPEKGDLKPRMMGHFICFDRWGQPSDQEFKNGMPFHGEATSVQWTVLSQPVMKNNAITAKMSCSLPIGGMTLIRTMVLSDTASVVEVTEEITNTNKLGRIYNIVQHPSIAPPFLDESVIVDSNALKGYLQESPMPTPEEPTLYWPKIFYRGDIVDFRYLADNQSPEVVSFVFRDGEEYGWVTACNPTSGLLVGYRWKTAEYPWLDIWRNVKDGKPVARVLEFGTTGLHQPVSVLLKKGTMFGRPLYEYIDANESTVKSYTMFLADIPKDCTGVDNVGVKDGSIVITIRTAAGTSEIVL